MCSIGNASAAASAAAAAITNSLDVKRDTQSSIQASTKTNIQTNKLCTVPTLLRFFLWKHSVQHRERFRGCCWCAAWASAAAARTNSSDVKSLDSTNLRKALKTEVHCSVAQDSSHSEFVTAGTVKIIKTVVRFHEFFVRKYWKYKISSKTL